MRVMAMLMTMLFAGLAWGHGDLVATPTSVDADGTTYGEPMPAAEAVDIDVAAADVGRYAGAPRAITGRITEVCQKQGCWLVLSGDNALARVFMHEHSFAVPKDAQGAAVVFGTLSEKDNSAAFVEHLVADGAAQPQPSELRIDATSVQIRPPR